jgi:catechol 2,3-dioxygenase-like lactoylglutathione lyase family enzyme
MTIKDWRSLYPTVLDNTTSTGMPTLINNEDLTRVSQIHALRDSIIQIETLLGTDSRESGSIRYNLQDNYIQLNVVSPPTSAAGRGSIYVRTQGADSELFYLDSDGNHVQITRDGVVDATGSGNTLDTAYDQGGPGVGRSITADAGAVQINAAGGEALDLTGFISLDQTTDPAAASNVGKIYVKNDGGDAELFYRDDGGNIVQITLDGALNVTNNTLDQAYDQGGAGSGRSITADSGSVIIDASGDAALNLDGYLHLTEISDPSALANSGLLYAKDDGGDTELFYFDDSGNAVQITKDGAVNAALVGNTLDQAYDQGGAGVGRSITADSGPVIIDASGDAALNLDGYLHLNEISDPTALTNSGMIYVKDDSGDTELYYRDDSGNIVQITQDGSLNVTAHNTLNQAYDEGGAGVGRTITADSGAVQINASGDEALSLDGYISLLEITDPAALGNTGLLYTKDDSGDTELYYRDDSGNIVQITQDGSLSVTSNTLDQAYDQGGAGVGRAITADSGAVQINASGDEALELDGYLSLLEISDPAALGNTGILYVKDDSGDSELYYFDDSSNSVQITKDGYVNTGVYYDDSLDSTGTETTIVLTASAMGAANKASGYNLDVYRNGLLMKYVASTSTDKMEWEYNPGSKTVTFVASGTSDWYRATYKA